MSAETFDPKKMPGVRAPGQTQELGEPMSELQSINIVEDATGELRVSSLIIAGRTENEHRAVLQLITTHIEHFDALGGVAFEMQPFVTAGGTQNRRVAHLNEQQATLLITFMKNTPVVVAFKLELVKQFYRMRQALAAPRFQIPQTYAAALELAALQAREIESLEAKQAEDAPKVLFADSVATSSTTILVGDLAKILKGNGVEVGANRLFEWLRRDGFLIRRQGADWNSPTQKSMELGLFRIKETAVTHSDGHVTVSKTPKVTGKGQAYLVNYYTEKAVA